MKKQQILDYLKNNLSQKRYEHSINVALMSQNLAKLYGEDAIKCELAGLLHDCAKEIPTDKMLQYINKSDIMYGSEFLTMKHIWHGFAGAFIAKEIFNIQDIDVLNAIKYHTVGRENMSNTEKIVFISDLTSCEPSYNNIDKIRNTIKNLDLSEAYIYTLKESLKFLIQENKVIYKQTLDSYNFYIK